MNKRDNEKEGFLARTWAAAKEHVGNAALGVFGLKNVETTHHKEHQAAWDRHGQMDKRPQGFYPTVREQAQAYERHVAKFEKAHPEHSSAVSHAGAVREATTGNTYSRVNSEETVARSYIPEGWEREMKHEGRTR